MDEDQLTITTPTDFLRKFRPGDIFWYIVWDAEKGGPDCVSDPMEYVDYVVVDYGKHQSTIIECNTHGDKVLIDLSYIVNRKRCGVADTESTAHEYLQILKEKWSNDPKFQKILKREIWHLKQSKRIVIQYVEDEKKHH